MRMLPTLANAAKDIDTQSSMSRENIYIGSGSPQPLPALVWMLDGNITYPAEIGEFTAPCYGWCNYISRVLNGNQKFLDFQKDFDGEL